MEKTTSPSTELYLFLYQIESCDAVNVAFDSIQAIIGTDSDKAKIALFSNTYGRDEIKEFHGIEDEDWEALNEKEQNNYILDWVNNEDIVHSIPLSKISGIDKLKEQLREEVRNEFRRETVVELNKSQDKTSYLSTLPIEVINESIISHIG